METVAHERPIWIASWGAPTIADFYPFSDQRWKDLPVQRLVAAVAVCGEVFTADAHDMAMSNAIQKYWDAAEHAFDADFESHCGFALAPAEAAQ